MNLSVLYISKRVSTLAEEQHVQKVRRNIFCGHYGPLPAGLTLTRSAELLKRPIRRTQFRMGSLLSSSMLWVQIGGWHCL